MNGQPDAHETAKQWAVDMLRGKPNRTEEDIRATVEKAIQAIRLFGNDGAVDREQLEVELRHKFSIVASKGSALDANDRDHKPWLPEKRATMPVWPLWERYRTHLERDSGYPPDVVNTIDADTSMVLERLENPERPGSWHRYGMVVGSVQSGKTANYIGLINKAVDAGYKLIVVLAGRHNNLRSQTQLRIDEGILGLDTKRERALNRSTYRIGVALYGATQTVVNYGTTSAEDGDFKSQRAQAFGVRPGRDPVLLVIKKERTALRNVLDWLRHLVADTKQGTEKMYIRDIPLLLLDDEADNASINTKDKAGKDTSAATVSAINGSIRKILSSFEKAAYVGYTATPFANIFINPDASTDEHGRDIFPDDFIINIKPPSNYIGPAKVFGLDGDTDTDIEARSGLPIVHVLRSPHDFGSGPGDDYALPECFPPKHKIDHVPTRIPCSLERAIRCFILSCATRRARGQGRKHNSMLVHVTRFTKVQGHTARLVLDDLTNLQRRLREGDGKRTATLRDELREIWEKDYMPTSKTLGSEAGKAVTWAQVDAELYVRAAKIEVMTVNGFAKQVLDYKDHEELGRSVIAIGGDKLSRGLTLEGLSVSYFLRTSKMYDTLMQMGRWFGYRPGYLDLCRLFTTSELVRWYRHIALAEAELRREFDYMVQAGFTPANYGLRVRTHPDGMVVTALNKMSHSKRQTLSWAGLLVETTRLPKDSRRVEVNMGAAEKLVVALGKPWQGGGGSTHVWTKVDAEVVAQFIGSLEFPPESARATGPTVAKFIRSESSKPLKEIHEWTVALVSARGGPEKTIGHRTVGLVERNPEPETITGDSYGARKSHIVNPRDESIDFAGVPFTKDWCEDIATKRELAGDVDWLRLLIGEDAASVALKLTLRWQQTTPPRIKPPTEGQTTRPPGHVLRVLRRKANGLLLLYPMQRPKAAELSAEGTPILGVALSFPVSDTASSVEYQVNKVWNPIIQEDAEYGEPD